jgi:hypothetical protein
MNQENIEIIRLKAFQRALKAFGKMRRAEIIA